MQKTRTAVSQLSLLLKHHIMSSLPSYARWCRCCWRGRRAAISAQPLTPTYATSCYCSQSRDILGYVLSLLCTRTRAFFQPPQKTQCNDRLAKKKCNSCIIKDVTGCWSLPLLICTWFLKNQFWKIKFDKLDYYCLCDLQKSISNLILQAKNPVRRTGFFQLEFLKFKYRSIGGIPNSWPSQAYTCRTAQHSAAPYCRKKWRRNPLGF